MRIHWRLGSRDTNVCVMKIKRANRVSTSTICESFEVLSSSLKHVSVCVWGGGGGVFCLNKFRAQKVY